MAELDGLAILRNFQGTDEKYECHVVTEVITFVKTTSMNRHGDQRPCHQGANFCCIEGRPLPSPGRTTSRRDTTTVRRHAIRTVGVFTWKRKYAAEVTHLHTKHADCPVLFGDFP